MKTNENKIWLMKYKDIDSDDAPWIRWTSIDEPSKFMNETAKDSGFYQLKVLGKFNKNKINSVSW